jgi:Holliday junction resolvase RusA-like endonuclease
VSTATAIEFIVPGRPVPKARARVVSTNTYTPARSRRAEEAVAWIAARHRGAFPKGEVAVTIEFYEARWTGDIDNLEKLVLDGLVKGGVLGDDRQVMRVSTERFRVAENERTVVRVEPR